MGTYRYPAGGSSSVRIRAVQGERLGEDTTAGKIEGLERLREAAAHQASEQAVRRQRERGKLTARERIELLLDPGTFVELDRYRVHRSRWSLPRLLKRPQAKSRG